MTRTRLWLAGALALAALSAGCAGGAPVRTSATSTPTATPTTAVGTTSTTPTTAATTTRPTPTRRRTTATPRRTPRPSPSAAPKRSPTPTHRSTPRAPAPRPPTAPRCRVPSGVDAAQVVFVDGLGSAATIRACRRSGAGYLLSLGPYLGHVGQGGVSWSKREGDLRTPAGTFPLRGGFGLRGNPGLRVGSWFVVDSHDVWVDDPGSALYNTHQRTPAGGRWSSAEPLQQAPAYTWAQVVGYNEARTPGRGSAIFLHVDLGHGTAGCVSLPSAALLAVLRWERPGAVLTVTP